MFEVYVLVAKKKPVFLNLLAIFCLILASISMLATFIGLYLFLPLAIIGTLVGYFLSTRNYEFEYSFFDDEVRFAKITNKSRRKKLPGYKMAEVIAIGPKGTDFVRQYEQDTTAQVRNLCSGYSDRNIFVLAAKGNNGTELVYFEPDEKYLDEVCKRFGYKVRR